jgi:hypothetical protein
LNSGESSYADELLGGLRNGGVLWHRDGGKLQRAKPLEARDCITPSHDSREHETLNKLTR